MDRLPHALADAVSLKSEFVVSFASEDVVTNCDVCCGSEFRSVAPLENVVQCLNCDYRFVTPRPSQEEIAAAYSQPSHYEGWIAEDAGRLRMWAKRWGLIRPHIRGQRILDIGAGIGTFLAMAKSHQFHVTGTELSTAAIHHAHERYGIRLLRGQLEDLGLPRGAFDAVCLWHVLEHAPHPSRLLATCRELLCPGGLIVIAVPNDSGAHSALVTIKGALVRGRPSPRYQRLRPGDEIHLSHFSPSFLRDLVERHGFQVEWMTIDDHNPTATRLSEFATAAYRAFYRLSRCNVAWTSLLLARKPA